VLPHEGAHARTGTIIAVDLSDYRLDFAKRLGADHVINAGQTSTDERLQIIRDFTYARGADAVIQCAGVPAAVPETLEMLRIGGLLVEAEFFRHGRDHDQPTPPSLRKDVRILGVGGEGPAAYGSSMRQMGASICDSIL
jgi:threonine dehydrogenase-like Zn-dependent dehydrogenase